MNKSIDREVLNVAIEDIIQPIDKTVNSDHLRELTSSIRTHGIREPLLLRRVDYRHYEILSGRNKYKAALLSGFTSVPAYITDSRFRKDIRTSTPAISSFDYHRRVLDEAKKYRDMLYINHISIKDIAIEFGKSEYAVKSRIDMLIMLSPRVQNALDKNFISERHARLLLKINSHERQDELLDMILNGQITVSGLKDIIDREDPMNLVENTEELTPITPWIGSNSKFINMSVLAQQQPPRDLYHVIDKIKAEMGSEGDIVISKDDSGEVEVRIRYPRVNNKSKVA